MVEISEHVKELIDKRNELGELYNSVHDQSSRFLIGEKIRKIDNDLLEVYGML